MIFIYKEIIKKYITILTKEDIKKYATTQNEHLTDKEATTIYNHIRTYHEELLNKDTRSFAILKSNLRKDLFKKIELLYNEYTNKYL